MKSSFLLSLTTALIAWPMSQAAEPTPEAAAAQPHVHKAGEPCPADHDHVHKAGEPCPADHDHVHKAGEPCPADHDHVHKDGEPCTADHDHVHEDGEPGTAGGEAVVVSVDPHSRHVLNLQVEEVPEGSRPLVHSLYGYLTTPDHAVSTYAMPCAGRISLEVKSAQSVRKGDLLYTVDSPGLYEQIAAVETAEAGRDRCREELSAIQERLDGLRSAGTRNSDLEEQLRFKQAEMRQLERDLSTAQLRLKAQLGGGELVKQADGSCRLQIRALHDGSVRNVGVSQGSWGEQGAPVLTMSNPAAMEVAGSLYAGNMPQFTSVRAIMPVGRENRALTGSWRLAEQVDPEKLTRALYFTPDALPQGARAGQLCRLDLYDESAESDGSIAVPDTAIVRVGLDDVVFAEVGEGRYAMLKVHAGTSRRGMTPVKGLMPGQRIVVKGGYELKYILPGEGQKKAAGHFHADGKFHEGEDH